MRARVPLPLLAVLLAVAPGAAHAQHPSEGLPAEEYGDYVIGDSYHNVRKEAARLLQGRGLATDSLPIHIEMPRLIPLQRNFGVIVKEIPWSIAIDGEEQAIRGTTKVRFIDKAWIGTQHELLESRVDHWAPSATALSQRQASEKAEQQRRADEAARIAKLPLQGPPKPTAPSPVERKQLEAEALAHAATTSMNVGLRRGWKALLPFRERVTLFNLGVVDDGWRYFAKLGHPVLDEERSTSDKIVIKSSEPVRMGRNFELTGYGYPVRDVRHDPDHPSGWKLDVKASRYFAEKIPMSWLSKQKLKLTQRLAERRAAQMRR
jgi:hypothetical protein